jgi:hypothetical protein
MERSNPKTFKAELVGTRDIIIFEEYLKIKNR